MEEQIMNLLGNLFFPIAAYGALFWYMVTQRRAHTEETEKLKDAIVNNTMVMQRLLDKMEAE